MEGQCTKQNFINSFFTVTGVVTIGVVISTVFVGYYCFVTKEKDDDEDNLNELDEYHGKFLHEFDELNEREIDNDGLKEFDELSLRTDTPRGEVVMIYSYETETFCYYADKTEISFKTLETVAREYCIKNDCKNLYVNAKVEEKNKKDADKKAKKLCENEKNEENKTVFVQYKPYNAPTSLYVMKSNRFTKKGKIDEWVKTEEQKETMKNQNDVMNNLDFNMFKKLSASGGMTLL